MANRLQGGILAGSTSVSLNAEFTKLLDNDGTTGITASSPGLVMSYWRQGGLRVANTVANNLAAVDSAYAPGGMKEVDAVFMKGTCRFDWDNAAFAVGTADWVNLTIQLTGSSTSSVTYALTTNVVNGGDLWTRIGANGSGLTAIGPVTLASLDSMVQHAGTAQAGAAASITFAPSASATDTIYVGSVAKIYGGTGAGQAQVIIAYNGTTKIATPGRNWTTAPDATSLYAILALSAPRVDDSLRVDVGSVTGTPQTARDIGGTLGVAGAGLTALGDVRIATILADIATVYGRIGAPVLASISADISSRGTSTYAGGDTAGTTTLLARVTGVVPVAADYSAARATKLDNLDAAISSRSTYAGADTAGTTTLLTRNTALDAAGTRAAVGLAAANLDTQLAAADDGAAVLAAIAALNNLSSAGAQAAAAAALTAYAAATTANVTAVPAAVLAAATAAPIAANVKKVTDVTLTGTGTDPDPWRAV